MIIKIKDNEYECPESWSEVTLKQYLQMVKVAQVFEDYKSELEWTLDSISALTDIPRKDLESLKTDSYVKLVDKLKWISETPTGADLEPIVINNVTYVFPKDLNQITMGESISIDLAIKSSDNRADSFINMLPILLRPGKQVENMETGEIEWQQQEFETQNLEARKKLFLDNIKVSQVIKLQDFFLNGENQSLITTQDSSIKK